MPEGALMVRFAHSVIVGSGLTLRLLDLHYEHLVGVLKHHERLDLVLIRVEAGVNLLDSVLDGLIDLLNLCDKVSFTLIDAASPGILRLHIQLLIKVCSQKIVSAQCSHTTSQYNFNYLQKCQEPK
jgi:hypothetical protein